ncbi:Ubiquitin carboxyl-terminal hydrolase 36 [Phlyctochytrium planicorne]|nr:Ubiquitin carboxyl-terminal hydrolase 36 [Phlyctochytrium planicorne]
MYYLSGVLVHAGSSVNSGHYYAFVRGASGLWHCMDDEDVKEVSLATVLRQKAYILFYTAATSQRSVAEPRNPIRPQLNGSPSKEKLDRTDTLKRENSFDKKTVVSTSPWKIADKKKTPSSPSTPKVQPSPSTSKEDFKVKLAPLVASWGDEDSAQLEATRDEMLRNSQKRAYRPSKYDKEYEAGKMKKRKKAKMFHM